MDGEYEDAFRRDVRQVGCYPKDLSNAVSRYPVVDVDYGQLTVHPMLYRRWQSGQRYSSMGEVEKRFVRCRGGCYDCITRGSARSGTAT
jgi:hypothetical protein